MVIWQFWLLWSSANLPLLTSIKWIARARGLRYPTWAFISTRCINHQTLFTPHCSWYPADRDRSCDNHKHSPIPARTACMPRQIQVNMMPSWMWRLYPGVKTMDSNIKTCCDAGNRMAALNNLFYHFNFKRFGITFTAHGLFSLSHLKWLSGVC